MADIVVISTLANWVGSDRKYLVRRLRESVKPSGVAEERLFKALLKQMVDEESATSKDQASGIKPEQAVDIIGAGFGGVSEVYLAANKLRSDILKVSDLLKPNPGAFLTRAPYSIEVTQNPPSLDKMYFVPCIGLILADATDWFVGDVLKGITQACQGKYDLIVEVSTYSQQAEARSIRRLAERVRGLLVVPVGDHVLKSAIKSLQENPCVLIDRYFVNVPDLPCVHPADKAAGRFAALYLKEQRCKRILVVDQGARAGTNLSITPLKDRQDGCVEADEDLEVILLRQAGTDEDGGYEALRHFEAEEGPIRKTDGIFALADHVAVGCQSYLARERKGLTVPLISVEGQRFGDFTDPPLLSIKFDNFEMGRLAAEILIARIEEKRLPENVTLPHTEIAPRLLTPSTGPGRREELPISVD